MNRIILFLFFIVSLSSYGQKYSLSSVQKNENGVTISLEEKQIEISFLKDNIIHVRTYPAGQEQKPSGDVFITIEQPKLIRNIRV
jgi:hypothetical protein